jgi:hypothetical protein
MRKTLFTVLAALIVEAIICCSEPKPAKASVADPTLGGCIVCTERDPNTGVCKVCKLSAHPTVIQPLAAIDLKESTLLYGVQAVSPGVCYGVTYQPGEWYASGANFCLNTAHTDAGNVVFPSGVLHFVKWGVVGLGGMCSDANSAEKNKLTCHALLLFGANVPIE